jgi:hypothetical protein
MCGLDPYGSACRPLAASSEQGNERSGVIKCGEFIDRLSGYTFSRRTLVRGIN